MGTKNHRQDYQSRMRAEGQPPEEPEAGPADQQQTIDQLRQNIRRMSDSDRDLTGFYLQQLGDEASRIPSIRLFQDDDDDTEIQ